jgi:hypothetical protein
MKKNNIKKELYKQKPTATFERIVGGIAYWNCEISIEDKPLSVKFSVPFSEIQDSEFLNQMPAQLLIRWII